MRSVSCRLVVLPLLALAAISALSLLSCSSNSSTTGPGNTAATVEVRGQVQSFNPESVTIQAGQAVTWTWVEGGHSVTSVPMVGGVPGCVPNGTFDSGLRANGSTFSYTFTTPGTYGYACNISNHCAGFESGVVVVQ